MPLIQSALLLAILGSGDGHSRPGPGDLDLYRAAAVKAGRDAEAHVRVALWCEARHLVKEHDAELVEALRINPAHAGARGLIGELHEGER